MFEVKYNNKDKNVPKGIKYHGSIIYLDMNPGIHGKMEKKIVMMFVNVKLIMVKVMKWV